MIQAVSVEDALAGMSRFRSLSDSGATIESKTRLDEAVLADLKNLYRAIMIYYKWDDDEFDKIFGDSHPIEVGFELANLISQCGAKNGLPIVIEFLEWIDDSEHSESLLENGRETVAAGPTELANFWLKSVTEPVASDSVASTVIEGLLDLAQEDPLVAEAIRPDVVKKLQDFRSLSLLATTDLTRLAVQLEFHEAAEAIEEAFSENMIDCGMMGDWEMVRKQLHVESRGLKMPEKPYNSLQDFRRSVGVGCFSKTPLFLYGEIQEKAVPIYLETACEAFARSSEGHEVLLDEDHPFAVGQFLELGVSYLGVTADSMTIADVREILLELYPRKVTIDASECDKVTNQLVAFWQFCDRVHDLESAAAFALEVSALRSKFRKAMSDPSKFGMGKSFFVQGQQAGFDMTTQEGLNDFMLAHNESITQSSLRSEPVAMRSEVMAKQTARVPVDLKQRKKLLNKKKKASKRKTK